MNFGTLSFLSPHFIIVDVRCMNSKELFIKNHPYLKSKSIELVLFHREEDLPLLKLVNNHEYFDLVPESVTYDSVLSGVVKRIEKLVSLESRILEIEAEKNALGERQILFEKQINKETEAVQSKVRFNQFCEIFWEEKQRNLDFLDCLIRSADNVSIFDAFIVFSCDQASGNIKSVDGPSKKIKKIPTISLDKFFKAPFEQGSIFNTCQYVSKEKLGLYSLMTKVKGRHGETRFLFCYKLSSDIETKYFSQINNFLENFISTEYVGFHQSDSDKKVMNEFEFFEKCLNQTTGKNSFYHLDLGSLSDYLNDFKSRFLGARFYEEFFSQCTKELKGNFELVSVGRGQYIFEVKNGQDVIGLKRVIDNFRYWLYFDDSENNFARVIDPSLTKLEERDVKDLMFSEKRSIREIKRIQQLSEKHLYNEKTC